MGYPESEWERVMRVQEVMMRALSGEIHWFQVAEILGVDVRTMRRWRDRFEHNGCHALLDRRREMPSPRRAPTAEVERVLRLYRERYRGFNVLRQHNATFGHPPRDPESAWVTIGDVDLDQVLCHEESRVVPRDNTVTLDRVVVQLAKQPGRRTCGGLEVVRWWRLPSDHQERFGGTCERCPLDWRTTTDVISSAWHRRVALQFLDHVLNASCPAPVAPSWRVPRRGTQGP